MSDYQLYIDNHNDKVNSKYFVHYEDRKTASIRGFIEFCEEVLDIELWHPGDASASPSVEQTQD